MKRNEKSVYLLILSAFFIGSCSTKNLIDTKSFETNLPTLKTMVLSEFKENSYGIKVKDIRNSDLKNQLMLSGIDELTVQYDSKKGRDKLIGVLPNNISSQDSLLLFSKLKVSDASEVSENFVYLLSVASRKIIPKDFNKTHGGRLNDSVWLQKNEFVTVTLSN